MALWHTNVIELYIWSGQISLGAVLVLDFQFQTQAYILFSVAVTMVLRATILVLLLFGEALGDGDDDCPADRTPVLHDEAKLHKDLFCAYAYYDFRPVKDHRNAVNVSVRFAIKYITFDASEETFTLHSWVALSWKDEFLTWAPSKYGGITEIQVESHEFWTPRLALFNADATMMDQINPDQIYTTCLLTSDGTVTCVPHLTHSGICYTSLRRWPYDEQNCSLFFGSWMHTGEQVNFTFYKTKPVVLDDYQNGPGWNLINVTNERLPGKYSSTNSTYPMLKYKFQLKRVAAGPAAIVVVPSIVIVSLTLISLLLDIKDNVRLLLICFSLYGHFMFLTEIGYNIPKHSADTPILLLFLRDSMVITLVGILETLFLMAVGRKVEPAPNWIVVVNRLVSNGPGKYVVFSEFDPISIDTSESKTLAEDGTSAAIEDQLRYKVDWIQFASILNCVLFIVAALTYFVLILAYIPYGG